MPTPIVLVITYAAIGATWQFALWHMHPNVGMGGLGVIYIVWPFLGLSTIAFWILVRTTKTHRILAFFVTTLIMLALTWLIHPKGG